jgi:hypothetical protein
MSQELQFWAVVARGARSQLAVISFYQSQTAHRGEKKEGNEKPVWGTEIKPNH